MLRHRSDLYVVKSCGCLNFAPRDYSRTHGHTVRRTGATPTYRSWVHAKRRCEDPKQQNFERYGGRGIRVCAEWQSFERFLADMGERPSGTTLDRLEIDGDYAPGNCRWATRAEQSRNTSRNRYVEHAGRRLILKDFAREMGVDYCMLGARVRRGESPAAAASTMCDLDAHRKARRAESA